MRQENKQGVLQKLRGKRGAAMLECALLVPFWMFVMFGIMDFCTIANAKWDTIMIARTTARYGSLKTDVKAKSDYNQKDMKNVQDLMTSIVLNNKLESPSETEGKTNNEDNPWPGQEDGDAVHSRSCVDIHLHLPVVWGTNKKTVCSDYVMMRMFEG